MWRCGARGYDPNVKPLGRKLGAEFFGTFFQTLVATGVDVLYFTGTGHIDYVSRWLARGFITAAMIYAFSDVSGAHIDPAVSLGFFVRRAMPMGQMLWYWIAQFAGGFGAALLLFALWGHAIVLGASHPGPSFTHLQAAIAEAILTFLLMVVILMTAKARCSRQAIGARRRIDGRGLRFLRRTGQRCVDESRAIDSAASPRRRARPRLDLLDRSVRGRGACRAGDDLFFARPGEGERKAAKGE